MANLQIQCAECSRPVPMQQAEGHCPRCGGLLLIIYDESTLVKAGESLKANPWGKGIWRYLGFLPISDPASIVSLGEGGTFLHRSRRLAEVMRLKNLYIKDETTNATGSFIDRGTSVAVTHCVETGVRSVSAASTGNLGASLSAYAAKAGLECTIHISRHIDLGKLYQMVAYGARIMLAENYDDAILKAHHLDEQTRVVSPADPYFLEGEKSTGFEICEQLGWRTPHRVIVPMGEGGHISMIWKGIKEFETAGLVSRGRVNMTGVQLDRSAPIATAISASEPGGHPGEPDSSFAIDIATPKPSMVALAVQAVRESGGEAVTVSDHEIFEAIGLLAKTEGIFAEPAAASTIAGVKRLVDSGGVDRDEEIVCVITGSGLKDPVSARRLVRKDRLEKIVRGVERREGASPVGSTKTKILMVCGEEQAYGYHIWKELGTRFGLSVKIPTVYQHLADLEDMALIEKVRVERVLGRPERYYYRLTRRGEKALEILRSEAVKTGDS